MKYDRSSRSSWAEESSEMQREGSVEGAVSQDRWLLNWGWEMKLILGPWIWTPDKVYF